MRIDRKLQKRILEAARDIYPAALYQKKNEKLWGEYQFLQNAYYLSEHSLIKVDYHESSRYSAGGKIMGFRITKDGIDFLEEDGGLSAILDKVVVKFDEDDLTKLLSVKLAESDLLDDNKNSIIATIKNLPAEGVKTVYTHLLNLGLKHVKDIPELIERISENL